jgi:hypothetical protein
MMSDQAHSTHEYEWRDYNEQRRKPNTLEEAS